MNRLKKLPQVSPSQMQQHLTQLFDDMTCEDDMHDVEFLVTCACLLLIYFHTLQVSFTFCFVGLAHKHGCAKKPEDTL